MDGALSVHAAMSLEGSERYFMSLGINDPAGLPPKTLVTHNYIKDQQTLNQDTFGQFRDSWDRGIVLKSGLAVV